MKEITKKEITEKIEEVIDTVKIDSLMLDEISTDVYIVHGVFPRFTKMCDETIRSDLSKVMAVNVIMDHIKTAIKVAKALNADDVSDYIVSASSTIKELVNDFTSRSAELNFDCICDLSAKIFEDVLRYYVSENVEQ